MRTLVRGAALLGTGLLMAACATPGGSSDPEVSRPAPESSLTGDLTRSVNEAGLAIFRAAAADDANTAVSPLSIGVAFGMLDAGASGPVADALDGFFGFPGEGDTRYGAFNALTQDVTRDAEDFAEPEEGQPGHATVTLANRVFVDTDFSPLEQYRLDLALHFGAGVEEAPLSTNGERAANQVNGWVADQTRDLIEEIVTPDTFNANSRLALVNTLYMKADWAVPFDGGMTWEQPFTLVDGSQVDVEMMNGGIRRGLAYEGDDLVAAVLPYAFDELSMTLIVPRGGQFEAVREGLDQAALDAIWDGARDTEYTLGLPRFEAESATNLRDVIEGDLGVDGLFGVEGLDGIAPQLEVSSALHATKVIVDEEGTEGAAVTVIDVVATGAPVMPDLDIRADRPFLYVITDDATGAVLFVGQVLDPR